MKKYFILAAVAATTLLTGCTEEVPPGYLGKVVTREGISPEQYGVGRAPVWGRDRLVLVETSSVLRPATVTVIMNDRKVIKGKDGEERVLNGIGLEMDFLINVRYRIVSNNKTAVNALLQDMTLSSSVREISGAQVYHKYGDMVIGQISREVLGKYTPEEVLGNLDKINEILDMRVKEMLANSPLEIASVSLGPITLPEQITARIKKNKDTELSEFGKASQQRIDMLDKANEIALAREQAIKEEIDALSLANQNKILNGSVTPEVLVLRGLQVREKEIEMMEKTLSEGKNNTVFIPYGAVDSTAAQMRMYQTK